MAVWQLSQHWEANYYIWLSITTGAFISFSPSYGFAKGEKKPGTATEEGNKGGGRERRIEYN